jgi:hypothetical protein
MAGSSGITAVKIWVSIVVAKITNVALMEFPDDKRKQFRFRHCAEDYAMAHCFLHRSGR